MHARPNFLCCELFAPATWIHVRWCAARYMKTCTNTITHGKLYRRVCGQTRLKLEQQSQTIGGHGERIGLKDHGAHALFHHDEGPNHDQGLASSCNCTFSFCRQLIRSCTVPYCLQIKWLLVKELRAGNRDDNVDKTLTTLSKQDLF